MHVFAWLSYLVHSVTNSILLYLFLKNVGYGLLKEVSKVKGFMCDFHAQGKEFLSQRKHHVLL